MRSLPELPRACYELPGCGPGRSGLRLAMGGPGQSAVDLESPSGLAPRPPGVRAPLCGLGFARPSSPVRGGRLRGIPGRRSGDRANRYSATRSLGMKRAHLARKVRKSRVSACGGEIGLGRFGRSRGRTSCRAGSIPHSPKPVLPERSPKTEGPVKTPVRDPLYFFNGLLTICQI